MWPTVPPIKSPSSPIMSTCVALDRYQSHQFYYFHLISSFSWFFDHLSIYAFAICRLRILRLFLTMCATSFINTRQSLPLCCFCFSHFMMHSSRWVSNGFVIWLCLHSIQLGQPATVKVCANLVRLLSYGNKVEFFEFLIYGIIVSVHL